VRKVKTDDKQKLVILGASLFAEEVADYVATMERYELVGFVEGISRDRCHEKLLGLPVIWIDDVGSLDQSLRAVCAVGSTKRKHFIQQAIGAGVKFTTLIHPAAVVSPTAHLGEGTVVGPGTVIAAASRIGSHVIINRGCLIGHHVQIGDYVTISPGVNIAGKSKIGDLCFIGMSAAILDGISVGANSVVGSGAVVTKDVPGSVQVMGIPARVTKEIVD
jgi:sugar O-acyltransferase (sialic acid O-acetyltransferase NeuD family)